MNWLKNQIQVPGVTKRDSYFLHWKEDKYLCNATQLKFIIKTIIQQLQRQDKKEPAWY